MLICIRFCRWTVFKSVDELSSILLVNCMQNQRRWTVLICQWTVLIPFRWITLFTVFIAESSLLLLLLTMHVPLVRFRFHCLQTKIVCQHSACPHFCLWAHKQRFHFINYTQAFRLDKIMVTCSIRTQNRNENPPEEAKILQWPSVDIFLHKTLPHCNFRRCVSRIKINNVIRWHNPRPFSRVWERMGSCFGFNFQHLLHGDMLEGWGGREERVHVLDQQPFAALLIYNDDSGAYCLACRKFLFKEWVLSSVLAPAGACCTA